MVIVNIKDHPAANAIFKKYNTQPIYSILDYQGDKYVVFEKGVAAALLEVDIRYGCQYKDGRITEHDKIQ